MTSLYFPENVFFHFSKIKDPIAKEKLKKLKRGEVYLFYTSKSVDGKRSVEKIWLDVKDIDPKLIPTFVHRIIEELNGSRINIFELAHVVYLLREAGHINRNQFEKILNAATVARFPASILKMLSEKEIELFEDLEKSIDDIGDGKMSHKEFTGQALGKLF